MSSRPSLTLPNEAYSIHELLLKYTQGIMPSVVREGSYGSDQFDDPDLSKVGSVDMTERDDLLREQRRRVADGKEKLSKYEKSRKKAEVDPGEGDAAPARPAKSKRSGDEPEGRRLPSRKPGSKLSQPDGED